MPFLQRGDTKLHYEETGSGYPMLLLAPGGLNSTVNNWGRMASFNPMEKWTNDFRMVAMDQRNSGESAGPLPTEDPWGEFIADQMAVLDNLGIDKFTALGHCIGCSYIFEIIKRHPDRIVCGVLVQPIGIVDENRDRLSNGIWQNWGKTLLEERPDLDQQTLDTFGQKMWWDREFVVTADRDYVKACTTPLIVMPGNDLAHPHSIGVEVGELGPNTELLDPWKDTPEMLEQSINHIRDFVKAHIPA